MYNQVGLLPPETLEEALSDLARIEAVGGWKNLAAYMNPTYADDPEEAGKWLRRAISTNHREVLHDRHIDRAVELGKKVGCHVLVRFKCQVVWGYENPQPRGGDSRRQMLLDEDARISARKAEINRELETENEKLRAVK